MNYNWIKINEIEFSPDDLSKKYHQERIYEKDINEESNINELVNDNVLIKLIRENAIPFKCEWEEREVKEKYPRYFKKRYGGIKHYFVIILIPENYESKYESILHAQKENTLDEEEHEEDVFEPIEKAKKIFDVMLKVLIIFSLGCITYMSIQSFLRK